MSKIGVVTIAMDNNYNCGNKLQAYALQTFLRKYGNETVALRYNPEHSKHIVPAGIESPLKKLLHQPVAQSVDDVLRIVKRKIYGDTIRQKAADRVKKFEDFSNDYVGYSDLRYDTVANLETLNQEFDYFVAGSDQVWNPHYEGAYPFYYLQFAEKGKRIAYAPSISVEEIPEAQKADMGKWIGEMDAISIREQAGQDLIRREFGLEAKLVCDPVFLLDKTEWQNVAIGLEDTQKYFAVYILGRKTTALKNAIRKIERKYKLKAVDIYTADDPDSAFAGPREFVGIIANAEFVLTDSFHGAALSVIFERPLVTLARKSAQKGSSRIENLLRVSGLPKYTLEDAVCRLETVRENCKPDKEKLGIFVGESKQYLLTALGQNKQ